MDTEEHDDHGRAAVRVHLFDRLDAAGLVRGKKGGTVADHAAMRARLADWLAYMSADNLRTLADLLIDLAAGPLRNEWPSEATVRNTAQTLQRKPATEKRIVTSWLASVEGPMALAQGIEVELFQFLRTHGRPPGGFDKTQMAERARENARAVERLQDRAERGTITPEERGWLERYLRDRAEVRGIIESGQARRAAAGADQDQRQEQGQVA